MTTQATVPFVAATGLTLTAKLFTLAAPDTEVTGMTGGTVAVTEYTTAKGSYVPQIVRASALPAGDYRIGLFLGSTPLVWGYRTFAGTDGEVAVKTPEAAVLNSATLTQLDDIETAVDANTGYLTALTSALSSLAGKFAGITLLADWLRRAFRKDVGTTGMATAETEIQTGATATYTGTTDNLEAIKDASGGGGGGASDHPLATNG